MLSLLKKGLFIYLYIYMLIYANMNIYIYMVHYGKVLIDYMILVMDNLVVDDD